MRGQEIIVTKNGHEVGRFIPKDATVSYLTGAPLMLTRQGGEGKFEVIWPERYNFLIDINESFLHQHADKLYFSRWYEDPDYLEEVIIRANKTGEILERIPGSIFITPSGEEWVLG